MNGRNVCIEFVLRLEDGTVVDASDGEPWCFALGDGSLAPGLEQAVACLAAGETGQFLLGPEDAYGFRDDSLVFPVPLTEFPPEASPDAGAVILFSSPAGDEVPGRILERRGDAALVDFNHPLAGLSLVFEVQLLSRED